MNDVGQDAGLRVTEWLTALSDRKRADSFTAVYGADEAVLAERIRLVRGVLDAFGKRFGDVPVRLFRAPGRINLRGMHVDTHGGYLNLMTHHREIVLAVTLSGTSQSTLANMNPAFEEVVFIPEEEGATGAGDDSWYDFISRPSVQSRVQWRHASGGRAWANYGIGAALYLKRCFPSRPLRGLQVMIGSDLPSGAALSTSAALSIAFLQAFSNCSGYSPTLEQLIRAEQDVEWYAGARVGMSDPTAILLGRPRQLLNLAVFAEDFSLDGARYEPFPADLALLVAHSHTTRNLSGAQRVQYALNRFAYSMAMTVLRAELLRAGWPPERAARMDRLSRLTPDVLGGPAGVYRLLMNLPETLELDALRERYNPPGLDEAYARYFDGAPGRTQPRRIPLRGPLLFGICESERARLFPDLLQRGDYEKAGAFMNTGHDGDRVRGRDGRPFNVDVSDGALQELARHGAPLETFSGKYGASSPALDALADAALAAGALGACLTGAGIAGVVLALCRKGDVEAVSRGMTRCLTGDDYGRLAHWDTPPAQAALEQAVVINHAVVGAGELTFY